MDKYGSRVVQTTKKAGESKIRIFEFRFQSTLVDAVVPSYEPSANENHDNVSGLS